MKLIDHEPWMDSSICAETDPDAFFPEKGGSTVEAKRICKGCPVRVECLEYALRTEQRFGVWGGYAERERRQLKRGIPVEAVIRRSRQENGHSFNCKCAECKPELAPEPQRDLIEHGTLYRYRKGCKCTECRAANAAHHREWYAGQRAADTAAADADFFALAAKAVNG